MPGDVPLPARNNIHATAIVAGTTGLLFTGPSGSGKSSLAFTCLAAARRAGLYAALIADDQVFLEVAGGHVLARRPDPIAGLIELRATGIALLESLPLAVMHVAISVVDRRTAERLPPENERFFVTETLSLPVLRLDPATADPLAVLAAFRPECRNLEP